MVRLLWPDKPIAAKMELIYQVIRREREDQIDKWQVAKLKLNSFAR